MRTDAGSPASLADAASRLDRALDTLEAAFRRPGAHAVAPLVPGDADRAHELEQAASTASVALGLAMAEVRRLLHEDPGGEEAEPRAARLNSPLESGHGLLNDSEATPAEPALDPAPDKEPTA